jgi:hypothetical protein
MDKAEAQEWLSRMEMWKHLRKMLSRWNHPKRFLLAKLLGKTSYFNMLETFTEEDKQTCLALLSPNGYAIYRALLIKRGLDDKDYVPDIWFESHDEKDLTTLNRSYEADKAEL